MGVQETAVTVSATVVDALRLPEVPVMVIVEVAAAAVLLAVRVSTLVEVAGLVANAAVTPAGRPLAARVTLPANGAVSVTVMVSAPLAPWAIDRVDAEGVSLKLPTDAAVTVSATAAVALSEPEVPVMVTVDVPAVAVLLAVRVSTLLAAAGLVPNAAVTPAGRPDAARVTLPANGAVSVTVMVSVPLAPCAIDRLAGEDASLKLPVETTPLQAVPLTAKLVGTALAEPFHVPLKPTPLTLPPAATAPL